MSTYVVLMPGDESTWETATESQRAAAYARHQEFMEALASRGHQITGGAQLTHSRGSRIVRKDASGVRITEGPYAETVEQLTGFYLVESGDLEDLADCVGILAPSGGAVEIRETVAAPS
jgi:hypothetical protein